jgi:hypothetical protein
MMRSPARIFVERSRPEILAGIGAVQLIVDAIDEEGTEWRVMAPGAISV